MVRKIQKSIKIFSQTYGSPLTNFIKKTMISFLMLKKLFFHTFFETCRKGRKNKQNVCEKIDFFLTLGKRLMFCDKNLLIFEILHYFYVKILDKKIIILKKKLAKNHIL